MSKHGRSTGRCLASTTPRPINRSVHWLKDKRYRLQQPCEPAGNTCFAFSVIKSFFTQSLRQYLAMPNTTANHWLWWRPDLTQSYGDYVVNRLIKNFTRRKRNLLPQQNVLSALPQQTRFLLWWRFYFLKHLYGLLTKQSYRQNKWHCRKNYVFWGNKGFVEATNSFFTWWKVYFLCLSCFTFHQQTIRSFLEHSS